MCFHRNSENACRAEQFLYQGSSGSEIFSPLFPTPGLAVEQVFFALPSTVVDSKFEEFHKTRLTKASHRSSGPSLCTG
jgi:hypothetical protein